MVVDAERDNYTDILHDGYGNVAAKLDPICVKNMVVKLIQRYYFVFSRLTMFIMYANCVGPRSFYSSCVADLMTSCTMINPIVLELWLTPFTFRFATRLVNCWWLQQWVWWQPAVVWVRHVYNYNWSHAASADPLLGCDFVAFVDMIINISMKVFYCHTWMCQGIPNYCQAAQVHVPDLRSTTNVRPYIVRMPKLSSPYGCAIMCELVSTLTSSFIFASIFGLISFFHLVIAKLAAYIFFATFSRCSWIS